MYAISFALVVVALITLVVGVFQSGLTFIWASIGSSVLAAIFLALGVLQKKPVQLATAGAPYGEAAGTMPATATEAAPMATEAAAVPATTATATLPAEVAPEDDEEEEEEAPQPAASARRSTRGTARPKAAPAARASAKRAPAKAAASTGTGSMVLAIPERGTYHKSSCRFVKGRRDTERITRATADRRGYSPCGVCRP